MIRSRLNGANFSSTAQNSLTDTFLKIVPETFFRNSSVCVSVWDAKPIIRTRPVQSPYPNVPIHITDELVRAYLPDVIRRDIERSDYKAYKEQRKIVNFLTFGFLQIYVY